MYRARWTYEFHKIFQLTCTVLFPLMCFGSSEGHLQRELIYWSQLASTCIVVAVVYNIIIWLKTLVMSLLMYLKSLKQTKVVSILVLLNWVKWCKLNARSFYSIKKYDKKWKNLICFSDFKYINSDKTNVFNQTIILYTTTATIQLHGSWPVREHSMKMALWWAETHQRKENCACKLENLVEFKQHYMFYGRMSPLNLLLQWWILFVYY